MGSLGAQEMVFIFLLALLIFGPKKLPELGKTIGKALTEFRRASSELKSTWEREMTNLERETESFKEVTTSYSNEIYNSTYDSSYYDSGAYGSESHDSTATDSSTVSASAPQGAESTAIATQENASTAASGNGSPAGTAVSAPSGDKPSPDASVTAASSETPAPDASVVKS